MCPLGLWICFNQHELDAFIPQVWICIIHLLQESIFQMLPTGLQGCDSHQCSMQISIISDIRIAVDYITAVILTSKPLFKLDNLWMSTAVTALEDIAWTVAYKSLFLLFSHDLSNTFGVSSQGSLTSGHTRSGGTNLNLYLFSRLL